MFFTALTKNRAVIFVYNISFYRAYIKVIDETCIFIFDAKTKLIYFILYSFRIVQGGP